MSEFREKYKSLPTEQLIRIVHVDHASYRAEAVEAARLELQTRQDLPDDSNLRATVAQLQTELTEPRYILEDRSLKLIPLIFPGIGFWIAIFQWAKKRKERARLAWTWWFYGILLRVALVLIIVVLGNL
jgi:hypothetical protein